MNGTVHDILLDLRGKDWHDLFRDSVFDALEKNKLNRLYDFLYDPRHSEIHDLLNALM